jgi:hypothetical protein
MPSSLEDEYSRLVEVAGAALAKCPQILSPTKGCAAIWETGRSNANDFPVLPMGLASPSELLRVEAQCEYDVGIFIKRYPELVKALGPFPVDRFVCSFRGEGISEARMPCGARRPYSKRAQVGSADNRAITWVPNDDRCQGQYVGFTIRRTNGEGISVEIEADYRRPAYDSHRSP